MANEEKAKEIAIENLNGVRPYDFETEREKKWYEIGLIDGKEAADVKYAKFASYEDKTLITTEWLRNNGFEKHEVPYLERCLYTYIYSDDTLEIEAVLHDEERGIWEVTKTYYDESNTDQDVVYICTLGQFRMFLAICGLDNLVNEFKA